MIAVMDQMRTPKCVATYRSGNAQKVNSDVKTETVSEALGDVITPTTVGIILMRRIALRLNATKINGSAIQGIVFNQVNIVMGVGIVWTILMKVTALLDFLMEDIVKILHLLVIIEFAHI